MPKNIKKIIEAYGDYQDGKKRLVEQNIKKIEAQRNLKYVVILGFILITLWTYVILVPINQMNTFEENGFYFIVAFFFLSYFFFYIGSKFIIKPSLKEISDDSSDILFLFSSERRFKRRSISIGLSIINTLIILIYFFEKYSEKFNH